VEAWKEIHWMQNLMSEIEIKQNKPSSLHIDNQSAIQVIKNPKHHSHMKQLELKIFWLADAVECNTIAPFFMHTDQMPADILIKPLLKIKVNMFNNRNC